MAVNIKNEEVSRLVSELARTLNVSITEAVRIAVKERLARTRAHTAREGIADKLMAIGANALGKPQTMADLGVRCRFV